MKNFFLISLFVLSFLSVYTPAFGSYDIIGPQWFLLSILAFAFSFTLSFFSFFRDRIFLFYTLFIFLSIISLLYTNNISISLPDLSRHITIYVLTILFINFFFFSKIKFYYISIFISLLLLYEVFYSLKPILVEIYFNRLKILDATSINLMSLRGVTGNKNIAAASIVLKSVFAFYLLITTSSVFKKILISSLLVLSITNVFILSARASLISIMLVIFFTLTYLIYSFVKERKFSDMISFALLMFTTISAFFLSNIILPNDGNSVFNRLNNIQISNESSSNRLQLWESAVDYIYNNPFIGCGIGNWKVESAYYLRNTGADYLVPYHAHNDFLEFTTELGLLGGFTYFIMFVLTASTLLRLIYVSTNKFKFLTVFLLFLVYSIDATFNFPYERPIMQIPFAFILSFTIFESFKLKNLEK
jgi:O-antigen ligase